VYNRGPRTEPCGTPVVIGLDGDVNWPTRTVKDRPVSEWGNHWSTVK